MTSDAWWWLTCDDEEDATEEEVDSLVQSGEVAHHIHQ